MSQEHCWDCGESYASDEVFDIPIFKKGYTIKWCFNCAMKQLEWSDYRLISKPKKYKKFRIKSCEDNSKDWEVVINELELCYEQQFKKIKNIDLIWGSLHQLANDIIYEEDRE